MISSDRKLIIGTRGSELALWQANFVKQQLANNGITAELKIIKTQGDRIVNLSFDKLEGKGFFTKELEEELVAGKIDLAVHSHKDLPTEHPPGLIIAAVSEREDPSELLLILKDCVDVHQKLSVKFGGLVGTSSNRRKAQLLAFRPDLEITDLRGNVPTRINKLRGENYDAIMLAKAGVHRLGIDLSEFHVEELKPTEFIPAPAQGALAIQIREKDIDLFDLLQQHLHSFKVAEELTIERNVLKKFGGGCHMPLGCYCCKQGNEYHVFTSKADTGEELPDRLFVTGTSVDALPEKVISYFNPERKFPAKVFISRDLSAQSYFRRVLEKHDIEVEDRSLIRTVPMMTILNPHILKEVEWVFFTSKNAVEYFFQLNPKFVNKPKFGVMGSGSEEMLRRHGYFADFVGDNTDTTIVSKEFSLLCNGCTVLFPGAVSPMRSIQKGLSPETKVIDLPVYETMHEEQVVGSCAEILVFTSPSNVEAYFENHLLENYQQIVAIGKSTGKKLDELNMPYKLPFSPDEVGLAEAVFGLEIIEGK